jgi:hypothetical protein
VCQKSGGLGSNHLLRKRVPGPPIWLIAKAKRGVDLCLQAQVWSEVGLPEISSEKNGRPIPEQFAGIEVNFCKTPGCPNFGVPPSREVIPKGRPTAETLAKRDSYVLQGTRGTGVSVPGLRCQHCGAVTTLKSNRGVYEEMLRIGSFLLTPGAVNACRNKDCVNHAKAVDGNPQLYRSHGRTTSGTRRFLCKACKRAFSASNPRSRHRMPHKNLPVFRALVNHQPLSRICEVNDIGFPTLYGKIDFIHRQCLAFAADRERAFAETVFHRLYLCSDRQDYVVNWGSRLRRKTVRVQGLGTADLRSGYVFVLTPNIDPSVESVAVEQEAVEVGDYDVPPPFRRHARLWLQGDYTTSVTRSRSRAAADHDAAADTLDAEVRRRDNLLSPRDDLEAPELLTDDQGLPDRGMLVHADYTMYGHFQYLRRMLGRVGKVRFFLDQDAGLKQACLAAFSDAVRDRWADVFFVAVAKDWTIDMKRRAVERSKHRLQQARLADPGASGAELRMQIMQQRIEAVQANSPLPRGKLNGVWIAHPFPDLAEPDKRICYLTDYDDYDIEHLAWLYEMASLRAIDTAFMQIRRRVKLFERGIPTARRAHRIWDGYAPYNPAMVGKMLDIFRVWRNWVFVGKDKRTAAQRLGVAKGKVRMEDIVYFTPGSRAG